MNKIDLTKLNNKELKEYKKKIENNISKFNNIQLVRKVTLNSAYGSLGEEYFRWYDTRLAEGVTKSGQFVIRFVINHINRFLNEFCNTENEDFIIAGDTDSFFLVLDNLVKKVFKEENDLNKISNFINNVCKKMIEPEINKAFNELCEYLSTFQNSLTMKREVIANKGIWTRKKRYILDVIDNEGVRYSEPKLKIVGIESVRSSTPLLCREKIKEAIKIIMRNDEKYLINFIENFKKEFKTHPIEDISFPRTVNGIKKYSCPRNLYIKGSPVHVKSAILYNHWIKQKDLSKKYETIKEGEKMKFIYLIEPNPVHSPIIGFFNKFPEEFGLNSYIDYTSQFEKSFIEPIKTILEVIGWNIEKKKNLSFLFK